MTDLKEIKPCGHGMVVCDLCGTGSMSAGDLDRIRRDAKDRRHLLARMAGNIAAGVAGWDATDLENDIGVRWVAGTSVAIARAILEEVDRVG